MRKFSFILSNQCSLEVAVHTPRDFFSQLQKQSIALQSYLADGSLTMEHLTYLESIKSLGNLPAGNNAINIFIIWKVFYLIIFKEQPIGIKLESPEPARAMHFLLEQTV